MKKPAKTKKCKTDGCTRKVEKGCSYCSYECACYDSKFNVKTGWK